MPSLWLNPSFKKGTQNVKRTTSTIIATALLAMTAQAQPPGPFRTNSLWWIETDPHCSHVYQRGTFVMHSRADSGITVRVSARKAKYFMARVTVANQSQQPIDVLPQYILMRSRLNTSTAEQANYKELKQQDANQIARSAASPGWANILAAAGAGMQRQTITAQSTGTSGTDTVTITVPDDEARERTLRNLEANNEARRREGARIADQALRSTTLQPGEEVTGLVYFDRPDKHHLYATIAIPIGNQWFMFPLVWEK
jgi:hypothetical protein